MAKVNVSQITSDFSNADRKRDALFVVAVHGAIMANLFVVWNWVPMWLAGALLTGMVGKLPQDLQIVIDGCSFVRNHQLLIVVLAGALLCIDAKGYHYFQRHSGYSAAIRWSSVITLLLVILTTFSLWFVIQSFESLRSLLQQHLNGH